MICKWRLLAVSSWMLLLFWEKLASAVGTQVWWLACLFWAMEWIRACWLMQSWRSEKLMRYWELLKSLSCCDRAWQLVSSDKFLKSHKESSEGLQASGIYSEQVLNILHCSAHNDRISNLKGSEHEHDRDAGVTWCVTVKRKAAVRASGWFMLYTRTTRRH